MGSATEARSFVKEKVLNFGLLFSQSFLKAIFASSFVQSTWDSEQAIGISR